MVFASCCHSVRICAARLSPVASTNPAQLRIPSGCGHSAQICTEPPVCGRPSRRLRPHFPPIADAPPTGCDHTSHRMRPLGSDLHRSLPLSHALPIDCGHTSRLSGHSAQICTMPKRKNPFDPDLYAFFSPNMSRLEIIQIVGGNGLVKASCFAHMIVSSPSRRPYLG